MIQLGYMRWRLILGGRKHIERCTGGEGYGVHSGGWMLLSACQYHHWQTLAHIPASTLFDQGIRLFCHEGWFDSQNCSVSLPRVSYFYSPCFSRSDKRNGWDDKEILPGFCLVNNFQNTFHSWFMAFGQILEALKGRFFVLKLWLFEQKVPVQINL